MFQKVRSWSTEVNFQLRTFSCVSPCGTKRVDTVPAGDTSSINKSERERQISYTAREYGYTNLLFFHAPIGPPTPRASARIHVISEQEEGNTYLNEEIILHAQRCCDDSFVIRDVLYSVRLTCRSFLKEANLRCLAVR